MTLHDKITAELDRIEATAKAAPLPEDQMATGDKDWWTYYVEPADTVYTERLAIEEFLSLHDPASVLRWVTWLQKVLIMHRSYVRDSGWLRCQSCDDHIPYPCPTLAALAEALGIEMDQ